MRTKHQTIEDRLLEQVENFEYEGLKGKEALDAHYQNATRRFADNPKSEYEINAAFLFVEQYGTVCQLYFHFNPQEAEKIVEAFEQMPPIQRFGIRFIETPCKTMQRRAAYNAIKIKSDPQQDNVYVVDFGKN